MRQAESACRAEIAGTPDAYAGEVHDPASQKSYLWNGNNPVAYTDPTGYFGEMSGGFALYMQAFDDQVSTDDGASDAPSGPDGEAVAKAVADVPDAQQQQGVPKASAEDDENENSVQRKLQGEAYRTAEDDAFDEINGVPSKAPTYPPPDMAIYSEMRVDTLHLPKTPPKTARF